MPCLKMFRFYFYGRNTIFGKTYKGLMNNPLVAIVILNYNNKAYLQKFLPGVLASTYANKKVVVADNASADDSVTFVKQHYPTVEIIMLDKNYGFAEGYNRALAQVHADYFVLLNSDVEVTPGWIEPIIALMKSDTTIAACQPKILSYNNKDYFEYAGAAGGWIDALGYTFSRGRVFEVLERDNGQYNENSRIFWASGAALFVQAGVYTKLGGLDGYFFAHMEEIDLCWRMQRAGYAIQSCPASTVYHVGGGTLPRGNTRKMFLNFRNNLIMMCKNLPWYEKLWKLPARIMLDVVFAFKSLATGDAKAFTTVFKVHCALAAWAFTKKAPAFKPASKPLQTLTGVYNGSLIWQHFARRKTTFSEIVVKKMR